jgi:hypothetical protein
MVRAGKFLRKTKLVSPDQLVPAAWKAAVGARLAARTEVVNLVRSHLVIQVEDQIWRQNLWTLRHQILRNLQDILGSGVVTDLEFRVGLPRRLPRREEQLVPDEADHIEDPVLRRLYLLTRKRVPA